MFVIRFLFFSFVELYMLFCWCDWNKYCVHTIFMFGKEIMWNVCSQNRSNVLGLRVGVVETSYQKNKLIIFLVTSFRFVLICFYNFFKSISFFMVTATNFKINHKSVFFVQSQLCRDLCCI